MYSVVTIICVDSIYTLSLCKKGIHWSINGTGIMGWRLGYFCFFLNTFVFFSLARFGFSKKSDEKQRSNKVHPYKKNRFSFLPNMLCDEGTICLRDECLSELLLETEFLVQI